MRTTDDRMMQVLAEIDRITSLGYPPTVSELADALHIGRSTVHYWLRQLRDEGCVEWKFGQARTLTITTKGRIRLPTLAEYAGMVILSVRERLVLAHALQVTFGVMSSVRLAPRQWRISDAACEVLFELLTDGLEPPG